MSMKQNTYDAIWRWHFYAGLIIFPVLLIMAVTGGMYLLQPQIEDLLYGDKIYLEQSYTGSIDHDALIASASDQFNAARIHSYQPPRTSDEAVQIVLTRDTEQKITVFLHPQSSKVRGTVDEDWRLMNIAKGLHGGLMLGTPGEIIVELVACWTLVLVLTGLYLWWPRGNKKRGTAVPKLGQQGRNFWRELHAVPGAWAGLWIMAIILTGLPWSLVWGDLFSRTGHAINEGFPAAIFSERPHSASAPSASDISMNAIMDKLSELEIRHAYKIDYPWFGNGVFAAMPLRNGGASEDVAYVFLDKRNGDIIKDLRWDDLGALGRASSLGVQFHEGRLFGPANQIINLIAVIVLIGLALLGPLMWWKRKPPGALGAPAKPKHMTFSARLVGLMVFLALFLPLFGMSILLILATETVRGRWKQA